MCRRQVGRSLRRWSERRLRVLDCRPGCVHGEAFFGRGLKSREWTLFRDHLPPGWWQRGRVPRVQRMVGRLPFASSDYGKIPCWVRSDTSSEAGSALPGKCPAGNSPDVRKDGRFESCTEDPSLLFHIRSGVGRRPGRVIEAPGSSTPRFHRSGRRFVPTRRLPGALVHLLILHTGETRLRGVTTDRSGAGADIAVPAPTIGC